ncbi:hypothetical protein AG1IA_08560 [Rhizoctonia solani AG-1 IA]|uniref:Uncharacterized protein n=1 Tax=Thanatephorus cucumeris (strain AG1-IA) TaxID=983506 RepID=L8WKR1_THACA|nr:hypothetical protein AG1IA_08560 [Rhizoctonia solani AG-1 IA]
MMAGINRSRVAMVPRCPGSRRGNHVEGHDRHQWVVAFAVTCRSRTAKRNTGMGKLRGFGRVPPPELGGRDS